MSFEDNDFSPFGFHAMHIKVTRACPPTKRIEFLSAAASAHPPVLPAEMFHFAEELNRSDPDVYTVLGKGSRLCVGYR